MTILAAGFIAFFGLLVGASCLWALRRPQWLFGFAKPMLDRSWLLPLAIAIRLVLGIALLSVADASRFPTVFTVLGWIAIVAAVALPFIGMARIKALIDWMEALPLIVVRLWIVVGIGLGLVLLMGVYPLLV
jgi:hypothetical protein